MIDYYTNNRGTVIGVGDYIDDPMDQGNYRKVLSIEPHNDDDATLHMVDGGAISANEVLNFDVLQPSEVV